MDKNFFVDMHNQVADNYNSFSGDLAGYNANGNMVESFNAVGSDVPTSVPYVFLVSNSTTGALTSVPIFDAIRALRNNTVNYGVTSGITVTSEIDGVTYEDFLRDLASGKSFKVQMTYALSSDLNTLTAAIKVETQNTSGQGAFTTLTPTIDPYQNNSSSMIFRNQYIMDKFTKWTIARIGASATIKYQIYPMSETSSTNQLVNQPSVKQFSDPNISIANRALGM